LFETRYDVGELRIWHWPVQQIEIKKAGAEARETGQASTRHPVSRPFVGFHFGDQEYTVTLASNIARPISFSERPLPQFPDVSIKLIPSDMPVRSASSSTVSMPPLAQTRRTLTDRRDNGGVPQTSLCVLECPLQEPTYLTAPLLQQELTTNRLAPEAGE
jgi:hypothetical protein